MRLTKKQKNKQQVTMTVKDLENIKKKASEEATKNAIKIMWLFPLWVLRNQGWAKVRLSRFMDEYKDLVDSFNKGYISLPDIAQQLYKETGIRIDEEE